MSFYNRLNRSSTPLASNGLFLGSGEYTEKVGVLVTCFTDRACVLTMEWSTDNENYDFGDSINVQANTPVYAHRRNQAMYFRVRLQNGSVGAQTFLRLHTRFVDDVPEDSNEAINGNIVSFMNMVENRLDSLDSRLLQSNNAIGTENDTDYDFDVFQTILVPSLPVAYANPYIKDPFKRNSWYLQNYLMGATSLYWYATDSPMGFRANSVLTLGQLTEAGGFYFALHIDKVDTNAGLPIFGLYTTPTGTDDASPMFYKTRKTYGVFADEKLYAGELIVCYTSVTVLEKISNILPSCRRVQLTQTSSVGLSENHETIRYLTINNDSLAPAGDCRWSIVRAGWTDGTLVRHFKFTRGS